MTNIEKIRLMPNIVLAKFLRDMALSEQCDGCKAERDSCHWSNNICLEAWVKWLSEDSDNG